LRIRIRIESFGDQVPFDFLLENGEEILSNNRKCLHCFCEILEAVGGGFFAARDNMHVSRGS
jgi:hypothetical protein